MAADQFWTNKKCLVCILTTYTLGWLKCTNVIAPSFKAPQQRYNIFVLKPGWQGFVYIPRQLVHNLSKRDVWGATHRRDGIQSGLHQTPLGTHHRQAAPPSSLYGHCSCHKHRATPKYRLTNVGYKKREEDIDIQRASQMLHNISNSKYLGLWVFTWPHPAHYWTADGLGAPCIGTCTKTSLF